MTKLAAMGGEAAVPRAERRVEWPIIAEEERKAVLSVLDTGRLVSNTEGETVVPELEARWAARVGVPHCIGVSNGTAALQLGLGALGVTPGDEVIVPALSFIASGLAPVHAMAIPVFADIDPITFNIDPAQVEALITERTAAIMPVHLHGLPAAMDQLTAIAQRHGLAVIEDAAQAHGATYRDRPVGSIGDVGAFSMQMTKNLPTCGEGGLVTTGSDEIASRIRMMRQFGEVIEDGKERDYVSYLLGWNTKLIPMQAAFALSQLDRFDACEQARQANVTAFLGRLTELAGLQVPGSTAEAHHVWHILRFRFDPAAMGLDGVTPGALRATMHRLLRAEGVPMSRYQLMPLPDQKVFRDRTGFGLGYPWTAGRPGAGAGGSWPVTSAVIDDSLTVQKRHLHPGSGPLLQRYADGFEKVWANLDVVAQLARAAS